VDLEEFDHFLLQTSLSFVFFYFLLAIVDFELCAGFLFDCHRQVAHLGQSLEVGEEVFVNQHVLFARHLLCNITAVRVLSSTHPLHHLFNNLFVESTIIGFANLYLKVVSVKEV
jgi:hypothetical protein